MSHFSPGQLYEKKRFDETARLFTLGNKEMTSIYGPSPFATNMVKAYLEPRSKSRCIGTNKRPREVVQRPLQIIVAIGRQECFFQDSLGLEELWQGKHGYGKLGGSNRNRSGQCLRQLRTKAIINSQKFLVCSQCKGAYYCGKESLLEERTQMGLH